MHTKQMNSLAVLLASWDFFLFLILILFLHKVKLPSERHFTKFHAAEVFCSGIQTGNTKISQIKFYSKPIVTSSANLSFSCCAFSTELEFSSKLKNTER